MSLLFVIGFTESCHLSAPHLWRAHRAAESRRRRGGGRPLSVSRAWPAAFSVSLVMAIDTFWTNAISPFPYYNIIYYPDLYACVLLDGLGIISILLTTMS